MPDLFRPEYVFFSALLAFCITGGLLARNRGRNIIGWGLLCTLFPIFLMIIYFNKPLAEVRGGFRRCSNCREFIPWKASACKYCATEQPPAG